MEVPLRVLHTSAFCVFGTTLVVYCVGSQWTSSLGRLIAGAGGRTHDLIGHVLQMAVMADVCERSMLKGLPL